MVDTDDIKWAVSSLKPYKSSGSNDIYLKMLQMGADIMFTKLCVILRASMRRNVTIVREGYISQSDTRSQVDAEPTSRQDKKKSEELMLERYVLATYNGR